MIEPVALGLEELPPLFDGCFYNGVIVVGKWDLRPVLLEEILIDMKAGAECLERRLQPLDGVLLLSVVETFVIHACDAQHHAHVAALGQKRCLVPKAIQVDVVVERRRFLPRLDDLVESQHQTTSTRGTLCLAAS